MESTCYRCHKSGHYSSQCPSRTPNAKAHPPARPERAPDKGEGPSPARFCKSCSVRIWEETPTVHTPTCGQPPSEPERIAAILDAAGLDRSPKVDTPFRSWARLRPRSEVELRAIARRQVADAREGQEQERTEGNEQ